MARKSVLKKLMIASIITACLSTNCFAAEAAPPKKGGYYPYPQQQSQQNNRQSTHQSRPSSPRPSMQQPRPSSSRPAVQQVRNNNPRPTIQQPRPSSPRPAVQQARNNNPRPVMQQTNPSSPRPAVQQSRNNNPRPTMQQPKQNSLRPVMQQSRQGSPRPAVQQARPISTQQPKHWKPKSTETSHAKPHVREQEPNRTVAKPIVQEPKHTVAKPVVQETKRTVAKPVVQEPKHTVAKPVVQETKRAVVKPVVNETKRAVTKTVKPEPKHTVTKSVKPEPKRIVAKPVEHKPKHVEHRKPGPRKDLHRPPVQRTYKNMHVWRRPPKPPKDYWWHHRPAHRPGRYRGYYCGIYYTDVLSTLLAAEIIHSAYDTHYTTVINHAEVENYAFIPKEAIKYKGHHYLVFSDIGKSMEDAQQFCESMGGHLATVGDDDKNERLFRLINDSGYDNEYFEKYGYDRFIPNEPVTYEKAVSDTNPEEEVYYGLYYWNYKNLKEDGTVAGTGGNAFICEWDR